MTTVVKSFGLLLAAGLMTEGCAYDSYGHGYDSGYGHHGGYYNDDYRGGNGYHGDHGYGDYRDSPFRVSQRGRLDPWLAHTWEGHKFIRDHYRVGRDNVLSRRDADEANAFFRRWADVDRDLRLTDVEIRTALTHTANNYGYSNPGYPGHPYPPADQPGECDARPAQSLIGERADRRLGDIVLRRTGAREIRWVEEGSPVTLDYRFDRVNVTYDRYNRVIDIDCG